MDQTLLNKLMEIKHLYEKGILTKEEMEAEKAKILHPEEQKDTTEENASQMQGSSSSSTSENDYKWLWIGGVVIILLGIIFFVVSNDKKGDDFSDYAENDAVEEVEYYSSDKSEQEDAYVEDEVYVEEYDDPYELDVWRGNYSICGTIYRTCETRADLYLEKTEKGLYAGTLQLMLGDEDLDTGWFYPDKGTLKANVSAKVKDNQMVVLLGGFTIEEGEIGNYIPESLKTGQQIFCIKMENGQYSATALGNMYDCFDYEISIIKL